MNKRLFVLSVVKKRLKPALKFCNNVNLRLRKLLWEPDKQYILPLERPKPQTNVTACPTPNNGTGESSFELYPCRSMSAKPAGMGSLQQKTFQARRQETKKSLNTETLHTCIIHRIISFEKYLIVTYYLLIFVIHVSDT